MARLNNLTQDVALATGDAFVCASEKQRDFWLGALTAGGRVDHALYERDPSLRNLIAVVPFGVDREPPTPGPALRGVVPGIAESDRIIVWPGGIWNWFDPLTVIRAVHEISKRRSDVRLYFLGVKHPNPEVPDMSMAADAVALADELGLRDRVIFFNFGWVPYAERGRYLLDADIAVSAHFDDVETRFAFRTRLLDCIWAELPIVTTRGDTLGDLLAAAGGGESVPFEDVDAWVQALELLLDDAARRKAAGAALADLREQFEWPRVLEPLRRLAAPETQLTPPPRQRSSAGIDYVRLRLRVGYEQHGLAGAARRLASRGNAAARRRF